MENFESLWKLLKPQGEYKRRMTACQRLLASYSPELQQRICASIASALRSGDFVNPNPYFAIEDAAIRETYRLRKKPQTLSYGAYYKRYGTTAPRDGWQMVNPTGQKVIYVKESSVSPRC